MKSDKIIKITVISAITFLLLSILGLTYAYFSLEIEGTPKDIVMTTGDLRLEYKDETELKLEGAFPGDSVSKVITVKNVGTKNATYSLYWGDLINTIENFELHVTLNCKSYTNYGEDTQAESGTCEDIYRAVQISDTITTGNIKGNISIEPNITHEYTVTVKFDDKNYDQNYNKNKTFTGKIGIQEFIAPAVTNCTFDGELTQGAEYVNGQYTYRYMQEHTYDTDSDTEKWININNDGWGVTLTNKESTEEVTSNVCTYINDKPLLSTSYMFYNSQASKIDVSNFNTSNITNMKAMFRKAQASNIKGLYTFNTSKVTDMSYMFSSSNALEIDVSNFNTSNVTTMYDMFYGTQTTTLDVSNFNTSKVTDMSYLFQKTQATMLDVSNFDTSNVTSMRSMFYESQAISIDISDFDTSKVTNMRGMFSQSNATIIDVSNFNTSKVTDMSLMFRKAQATILDVSSFDTSKVTDMDSMFSGASATSLDVSNFNTSNVTNMRLMFQQTKVKELDVSNFDTSNVTDMEGTFNLCYSLEALDVSNFNTSKVTNMKALFQGLKFNTLDISNFDTSNVTNMDWMFKNTKFKTIYVSEKFDTTKVTTDADMFLLSYNIVGGNGTAYNSSYVDKTYARIDTASTPGYFTAKQ